MRSVMIGLLFLSSLSAFAAIRTIDLPVEDIAVDSVRWTTRRVTEPTGDNVVFKLKEGASVKLDPLYLQRIRLVSKTAPVFESKLPLGGVDEHGTRVGL